ncbi:MULTISPECIES: PH domain-containing protein [unclassified Methanosarcina]|uniref:PH domain-containing protein n=1 Tax=unclassified Methanosarcina TaxID=2644672 RepID=UPI0019101406|nr:MULTISPECIES: PH domain-containing protein [unclassified Methanosarcina]
MKADFLQTIPDHQIDEKAVSYWRWSGLLGSFLYWLVPLAYYGAMRLWNWPGWILSIIIVLVLLISFLETTVIPNIRWKTWRYDVSEHQIDLYHGVFIKYRTLIPMVHIQHVDTVQGPLMRHFGISTVTVSTAADEHEIPALADDVAAELREKISVLARVVDEDV